MLIYILVLLLILQNENIIVNLVVLMKKMKDIIWKSINISTTTEVGMVGI